VTGNGGVLCIYHVDDSEFQRYGASATRWGTQYDEPVQGGSIVRRHCGIYDRPVKGYIDLYPRNGPTIDDGDGL
jgi:hypothetical protein